jgi:hypothetical protein
VLICFIFSLFLIAVLSRISECWSSDVDLLIGLWLFDGELPS